jgi:hypothetical protein
LRQAFARARLHAHALLLRVAPQRASHHPLLCAPSRRMRHVAVVLGTFASVVALGGLGVWWRLSTGPISLDVITPWLTSALEERFGDGRTIDVGGTVLERDEEGRVALRLRDIVVRHSDGTVVATAPRAEIGIVPESWLSGHPRADRLNLIGAEMALRIEPSGRVDVFAGKDSPPTPVAALASADQGASTRGVDLPTAPPAASEPSLLGAVVGWLQSLDTAGLDGRDLGEIGLKNGSIAVDDRRTGKQLNFGHINLSLTRLKDGGAALALTSQGTDGPWSINATVTPRPGGVRAIEAVVRDVSPKDIMLALRLDAGDMVADFPLSAVIRGEIGPDGVPRSMQGRILAGAGAFGSAHEPLSRVVIDEAQVELRWDAANHVLVVPVEIHAGRNRIVLVGQLKPPASADDVWSLSVPQGMISLVSGRSQEPPLVLDRLNVEATYDPAKKRANLTRCDLRGAGAGVAVSGVFDGAGDQPRVSFSITGTPMGASAFKRLWPAMIAPKVHAWVDEHILAGSLDRLSIAGNTPLRAFLPDVRWEKDALSIDMAATGVVLRPVDGLPPIRNIDLTTKITGRTANVGFGRGQIELPSGRKLTVAGGAFDVPDTGPAALANTKLRIDGPMDAAVELLAMEPLRDAATLPIEASTAHGSVSVQAALSLRLKKDLNRDSVRYAVDADLNGVSIDRFVHGQKAEASTLHASATQDALQVTGDVKLGGAPATIDYRKARGEPDAELRLQTVLDDSARQRLGLDLGSGFSGPVSIKMTGRLRTPERDSRFAVDADLTQAKVSDLLPGWVKPAGRPARVTFVTTDRGQSMRLDDFVLDGSGASVRGSVEIDGQGEVVHANFPTFAVSDGDKASLKADRGSDGALKVVLRGDLYDGRNLLKTAIAGHKPEQKHRPSQDLDLDIKLGAVTGHHGEAVRAFDLKMSRRGGHIRSFALAGKLGSNGRLTGDMRPRGTGRSVLYFQANDAGALLRFTDTYAHVDGGAITVAMDPPTTDNAAQDGLLNLSNFTVRGESALDRVASSNAAQPTAFSDDRAMRTYASAGSGVAFSRMRVEFTKSLGRVAIRDGVVWGPAVGATVDGNIDYFRDEVRLRGTFVPAYGLNNLFSRVPVVGMFLGGGANEGLLGVTYQVAGSPQSPVLQVNPMSAVAPGFLRKIFEFRGAGDEAASTGGLAPIGSAR